MIRRSLVKSQMMTCRIKVNKMKDIYVYDESTDQFHNIEFLIDKDFIEVAEEFNERATQRVWDSLDVYDGQCYADYPIGSKRFAIKVWIEKIKKWFLVESEEDMSVSKWAYAKWKCEGECCVGDCDMCSKAEESYCDPDECTHDGILCEECEVFKESEGK